MTPASAPARVCVALPVRDGRAYFAQAIESVLAQADVDVEVRVLDNGSTDGSLELAREYAARDPRVIAAANPFDLTYYGSLNRALAETGCEFFVPFASDDVMYPGNLACKVHALRATGAALASSTADQIAPDGTPLGTVCPDHSTTARLTLAPGFFRRLIPANFISCQSVVVRTDALRAVGGFDVRSYYAADWLAWLRLSLRHAFATLPEPLIANRMHAATITHSGSMAGLNGRDVPATLEHAFGDERLPDAWRPLRDTMVSISYQIVATSLHEAGIRRVADGWASYTALLRALARTPGDHGLRERLQALMAESGLAPASVPLEVVGDAPRDAGEAAALAAALAELRPLTGRVLLAVDDDDAREAANLLEPWRGDALPEVVLATGETTAALLRPGRLALARWGDELVARAEDAGVPVFPYAMPDPFAAAPDPARFETLDPAAALAA
ncbi:MAG TPA: glycosyltransferase [Baekduia sp.]|uniref:glycosyltransferase family 2 protein n=1 Tax=Baekduia sp. TaxID=2600305 RepID=UPI002D797F5C|nr:glycosyltransferase [Baekduia sp.]HET6508905.1 glycosyltransferase [Baekduia sp.]